MWSNVLTCRCVWGPPHACRARDALRQRERSLGLRRRHGLRAARPADDERGARRREHEREADRVDIREADVVENVEAQRPAQPDFLAGRRLVLVDDVMTSGATLNAAARVLLRAGARQVDALVFARVVTGA